MRERNVEKKLVEKMKKIGGISLKFVSPEKRGMPDRICVFPGGRIVFVETKKPKGGVLSPIQKYQIEALRKLGCDVRVVKNYEEIDNFICEVMKNKIHTT